MNTLAALGLALVLLADDGAPEGRPGETVDGERFAGRLERIDESWRLAFEAGGEHRQLAADELIRWGRFREPRYGTQILLADGGTLVADLLSIGADAITIGSRLWREAVIPLQFVRAIAVDLPAGAAERDGFADRLAASGEARDVVILDNGDIVAGTWVAAGRVPTDADEPLFISIQPQSGQPVIEVPLDKVVAVILNSALIRAPAGGQRPVTLGFTDSSQLEVLRVERDDQSLAVHLAGGIRLATAEADDPWQCISAIQPKPQRVTYLSDLESSGYRHTPWLAREWPWRADRAVSGTRLRAGGSVWLKGVSMHSRSRLAYDLDARWRWFRASVAIDDSAGQGGSVVFRVYLQSAHGQWQAAYESPTVRGGEPPVPIQVELAEAVRVALVVDYADRGDERDYADWLGARFVADPLDGTENGSAPSEAACGRAGEGGAECAESAPLVGGARRPAAGDAPIALHPENPHYFLWRGKPTILVTSGEHYGALLNLDFDYKTYFRALAADGLNHTRVFSGSYREIPASFGITENPLAPRPGRYAAPWARSEMPGYFDGGNKFDLSRWDESYFRRLRDFMADARRNGIVVELTLFCPMYNDALWQACPMNDANNINGVGACARTEAYTLAHESLTAVQVALTRKLVAELNEFDNLYFEVCNEPYFGGVTRDWQHRIVDTIVAAEKDLPNRHLISLNIANGRETVVDPHPAVSIFNFHYCVPPDTVGMNYALNKVIGENETGFRGQADVLYRTEAWDFLLAGGALYNNLDYSFTPSHPAGTLREYRSPGGGSPELRRQLAVLKRFLESFAFVRMAPTGDVTAMPAELSVRALAEPGRDYAVYVHVPIPHKPDDAGRLDRQEVEATVSLEMPPGIYEARWINTRDGSSGNAERFEHAGGKRALRSPVFRADVALRVRAIRP